MPDREKDRKKIIANKKMSKIFIGFTLAKQPIKRTDKNINSKLLSVSVPGRSDKENKILYEFLMANIIKNILKKTTYEAELKKFFPAQNANANIKRKAIYACKKSRQ